MPLDMNALMYDPMFQFGMGMLGGSGPGTSLADTAKGGLLGLNNLQDMRYRQARMDELQRKREEAERARQAREEALSSLPPDQAQMIRGLGIEGYSALNPRPGVEMQGYMLAQAQGYPGTFMDYQRDLKMAGATNVTQNVTQGGLGLTPGQEAVDKAYAKQFVEYGPTGSAADVEKQIAQLQDAYNALGSGENLTGEQFALIPESLQPLVMPESVNIKESVEEVVQRNLRLILGAQFTEREGERLIARAYNPKLDEATNRKRIGRLIAAMKAAHETKRSAAEYFFENGTLRGWGGKLPSYSDFYQALDTPMENEVVDFSELKSARRPGRN